MSEETLKFIAHELSKVLPAGAKRRVWLKAKGGEVIVDSRL
ncbi:hypothetical protein [Bradyrhizobium sp. 61]|nr:hypothetical protein [Bradyrhizobium sp. 61]